MRPNQVTIQSKGGAVYDGKVIGADSISSNVSTGDQQITSAGFVDIVGLTFPLNNGDAFHFEAFIVFQTSVTTMGVLFAINGPSQSLLVVRSQKQVTVGGTASTDMFSEAILIAYDTPLPSSTMEPAQNTNLLCAMRGIITATASGTFAIRFSKENVAGTATVKAGSFIKYRLMQ